MGEKSASISSLLCTLLISDAGVLDQAWQREFTTSRSLADWRHAIYVAYHPWAARYPDHVFDTAWRTVEAGHENRGAWLGHTLLCLVKEYLECKDGKIHVKLDRFGAWQQSVLSRITSLPVQAAARVFFADTLESAVTDDLAPWANECLPMLRPCSQEVDTYVTNTGLNESHLHLNGTTYSEVCWLRALRAPDAETKDFLKAWTNGTHAHKVRELVALINPRLSPTDFNRQLRVARLIREWLIASVTGAAKPNTVFPLSCEGICISPEDALPPIISDRSLQLSDATTVSDEIRWQSALIKSLTQSPSVQLESMFHCYLILQNQYYRLMVQSENNYGFDQFQKFTFTNLRVSAERDYLHRFQVIHGQRLSSSRVIYLEGRFAPKASQSGMSDLLHQILEGYRLYLIQATGAPATSPPYQAKLNWVLEELEKLLLAPHSNANRSVHRLVLVAHFIKMPWSATSGAPYRHYELNVNLQKCTNALLNTLKFYPKLKDWIRGVDGAANELHAPPDCFASVFRMCKTAGLKNRTFHAGEDFPHLLSGIRYMLDALELLDLQAGDRLGHGTAMGIRPGLWIERMPQSISISRGDWMLSVLAGWRLLRGSSSNSIIVQKLRDELDKTVSDVFGEDIATDDFEKAMALRDLSVQEVSRFMAEEVEREDDVILSDICKEEARRVANASRENRPALELFWRWQSDQSVWQKSEELVQKDAAFLDESVYVELQRALMQQVKQRDVVIETLPSSNVRISQYVGFNEHHALRWMGLGNEPEPEIKVSLGSDDPGIFAADLESEFYHLFAAMSNSGISETDALQRLSKVNECGKVSRFHHPRL